MEWERVREHFLFLARVPGEEEDCCSKAHLVPMILFCSTQAAAPKMQGRKHTVNTRHTNYTACGWWNGSLLWKLMAVWKADERRNMIGPVIIHRTCRIRRLRRPTWRKIASVYFNLPRVHVRVHDHVCTQLSLRVFDTSTLFSVIKATIVIPDR